MYRQKNFLEHIFNTKQYFHEAGLAMYEADLNAFKADYVPVSLRVRSDSQIKINIMCTRCVLVLHRLGRDWAPGLYMGICPSQQYFQSYATSTDSDCKHEKKAGSEDC